MAAPCLNAVSCLCSTIFQVGMPGQLTNLGGLLWQLPVTNTTSPPWNWPFGTGGCTNPPDVISGLSGSPGRIYNVALLIRGISEPATYTIGAAPAGSLVAGTGGLMSLGGAYVNDGHNLYSMAISDPPATYYLNNWDGTGSYGSPRIIRYNVTVPIKTGATLTLHCDGVNQGEATNYPPVVITALPGEPPIQVAQPPYVGPPGPNWPAVYGLFGQFCQVDVLSIT
jgi:hypothetical protein